ncbi:MAG: patatin-like phospholipase family protein [Methyloligellaceae bacterium]
MINFFARDRELDLALQGGGSFGAFTWGVLDRMLEEPSLTIGRISGTSAGAVNAVAYAAGYLDSGADGARQKLRDIWQAVALQGTAAQWLPNPFIASLTSMSSRPLSRNPLRNILESHIDFAALREQNEIQLFIAATHIATGRRRIFTNRELTVDTILASACLPTLFKAVEIDGNTYWDGGYSANPDLQSLFSATSARDILIVLLNPLDEPAHPTSSLEIAEVINRITFNQPFLQEMEHIRSQRKKDRTTRKHRFHLISAEQSTQDLAPGSKLNVSRKFILHLHEIGYQEATKWLKSSASDIGRKSTTDLFG